VRPGAAGWLRWPAKSTAGGAHAIGMKLVLDGDSWRVEGKGSERARVAYAQLDGDDIVYPARADVGHVLGSGGTVTRHDTQALVEACPRPARRHPGDDADEPVLDAQIARSLTCAESIAPSDAMLVENFDRIISSSSGRPELEKDASPRLLLFPSRHRTSRTSRIPCLSESRR